MSHGWKYLSGDWNVTCDSCGKKIKASQARERWDGFIVCPKDYEQRHPQDFVRARQDKITVPYQRPIETPSFAQRVAVLNDPFYAYDDTTGDYIDPTYFAEDYISMFSLVVSWNRSFSDASTITDTSFVAVTKPFTDTVTMSDNITLQKFILLDTSDSITVSNTGTVFLSNYVDFSYFYEDYVGQQETIS